MKLKIKPIYGWGWRVPNASLIEVPSEFQLEAEETPEGIITGRVSIPGHPLDSYWVVLTQRHVEKDGYYNLSGYEGDPRATVLDDADVAGVAQAELMQP